MNAFPNRRRLLAACALAPTALAWAGLARAHGGSHGTAAKARTASSLPPEQKPWGIAGDPDKVTRTIEIVMKDDMTFTPSVITVQQGETVRLRAVNQGRELHEIVLGSVQEIEAHAEMMRKHPGMEHDEPWMAHVAAGKSGDVVWHFNRPGRVDFACLVDDHYELGMAGRIDVQPRKG